MSNEQQDPRDPERSVEPELVDPDAVVLDEGTISAEALEPELSVSPDTLHLQEPTLEPVEISRDIAEAASLEDAAAEARAVAAEAEEAGTLVGGPMPKNTPTVDAAPAGTAPSDAPTPDEVLADAASTTTKSAAPHPAPDEVLADATSGGTESTTPHPAPDEVITGTRESASAGMTEHVPTEPTGSRADVEDSTTPSSSASDDPPTRGGPSQDPGDRAIDPVAGAPTTGVPAVPLPDPEQTHGSHSAARAPWVPGGGDPEEAADPEGQTRRDRRGKSGNTPLLLMIGAGVVVLGLIIWLLVSLLGGAGDEDQVDPSSLAAGECLAGFTDITEDARLVDCTEPHNAQLVASESYPDEAEFPGRDQLGLRAEAACAAASANVDPDAVTDVEVSLLRATPTTDTWADGDRRVDCFAVVENEGTLSRSMLNS